MIVDNAVTLTMSDWTGVGGSRFQTLIAVKAVRRATKVNAEIPTTFHGVLSAILNVTSVDTNVFGSKSDVNFTGVVVNSERSRRG